MYAYTLTIGRGTGEDMLDEVTWATFEDRVNELLADYVLTSDGDVVEMHRGTGVWDGETEESTKVTLLSTEGLSQAYVLEIRVQASRLAEHYGQDAIAFTIGQSELISSDEVNA